MNEQNDAAISKHKYEQAQSRNGSGKLDPSTSDIISQESAPPSWIPHAPWPKQQTFLDLQCLEALYGGAAGGGKSEQSMGEMSSRMSLVPTLAACPAVAATPFSPMTSATAPAPSRARL